MTSATQIQKPSPEQIASTASHAQATLPEPVVWRHWPLVDDWRSVLPLAALAVVLLVAIGLATQNFWNVLFAAAVLVGVSWRIWMPARYEVNSRGLVQSCLGRVRRISWTSVPRVQVLPRGMRLLRDVEAGPLDAWSGLFVPWGDCGAEVLAVVKEQVKSVEVVG